MPQHKSIPHHVFFESSQGAANARVGGRQEPHRGQQQDTGIEQLRAVGLDERVLPGIKTLLADIAADLVAQASPAIEWPVVAEFFGALNGAIECDPGHHFRRDIMPGLPTSLPDAVIRLIPYLLEMLDHRACERPGFVIEFQLGQAPLVKRIDQFAVHVELQLGMRGIADPDRPGAFIAHQPVRLPFQQAPLAEDAVHDLHVLRRAGGGAQQPIVPGQRLFGVAGVHQRQQREGGVAQPAKPVVPVAAAAELFRQRGRRRRDDAAGRRIGERLQRDQRSHQEVGIFALIGAMAAPLGPEILGVLQGLRGVDRFGDRQMRRPVGEHEGNGLALAHFEIGHCCKILAAGLDRRAQHRHVLPGNRQQRALLGPPDPGNVDAEAEADHKLHHQPDPPAHPAHQPDDVGGLAARRHEIDQFDDAARGFKPRLQDQRIVPVAARGFCHLFQRRDQPPPVSVGA